MIDTSALQSALTRLEEMHAFSLRPETVANEQLSVITRTALIKGYEFTYEMATKTMKRFVEDLNLQKESGPEFSFREMLRFAYEQGLIRDIAPWVVYRERRNETSHAYAENKALDVVGVIPAFLKDTRDLLESIEKRLKDNA